MLSLQRHLIFLLISTVLPLLSSKFITVTSFMLTQGIMEKSFKFILYLGGLQCKCTDDCPEKSTCNTTAGGVCYVQYYSDVSGKHWNLRKGCLDDPSSVICQYTKSDSHTNVCCNEDMCNDNLSTNGITTGKW